MKRLTIILLAVTASISALAQNNRGIWNPANCEFRYDAYQFSWSLPDEIDWERREATGRNICFKAIDPETGILLMVNLKDDQLYGNDMWEYYSYMNSKEYQDYLISGSKRAGVDIKSIKYSKCTLSGKHAILSTSVVNKYDPAYGGNVDFYELTYTIAYNNKSYTITMQTWIEIKNAFDEFDLVANEIFKGIRIGK